MTSLDPGRQGEDRRCRIVHFDVDSFLSLLRLVTTGTMTVENPLPLDARVTGVRENWYHNSVDLLVWSKEFDSVPEGEMFPDHDILFTWHAFPEGFTQ